MAKRNGATAKLWLAFLANEGKLTASEAAAVAPSCNTANLHSLVNTLVDNGMLCKFIPPKGYPKFGITADCKVPQGVTIGEILACQLPSAEPARC